MYQNKFAVALKSAGGQILREFDGDKVYLPFGSEYSVYLKNMHSRRAVAQVSIDGQDIGDGMTFVIPAHGTVDLERFVKNGNLDAGNRFKFIERTDAVAEHRGVDVEDGLVRVTFQLEKEPDYYKMSKSVLQDRPRRRTRSRSFSKGGSDFSFTANASPDTFGTSKGLVDTSYDTLGIAPENETGVTAPGSFSDQSFTLSDRFPLEAQKTVIVLQILGETEENREIRRPVTVKTRPRCVSCGTVNRAGAKFCIECGTSLQIV